MASNKEDIISQIAQRLGIEGISLKKAETLHRVLTNKDSAKSINCTTKAVLCLDLATSAAGVPFDKDNAIKLSGVKKSIYQSHLNNVESILQLNRHLTVSEICVKMSCIDIRTFAEDILDKYQLHNIQMDFNHSQYPVAAVYTACKLKGVKVQRREFATLSKLKTGAWKDLENEFANFVKKIKLIAATETPNNNDFYKTLENHGDNFNKDPNEKQNAADDNLEVEEYDVWKNRILEEARKQLKNSC